MSSSPENLPMASTPADASQRTHLLGLPIADLREWLVDNGQQKYRTEQILDWIYAKNVTDFAEMTNLSKGLRTWLAEHADVLAGTIARDQVASDDTRKLLVGWPDGATAETVWIPERDRNTACVSSQVGCPVGCTFCASGLTGLQRNLTPGEIVEQALRVHLMAVKTAEQRPDAFPPRLTNIVFMGMGEPLANYDAVVQAIRIINAPWGLNIGARKITVSTVGLPKQIRQLAQEGLQLSLALSLHAPEQSLREQLIPWGKVPLDELIDACGYYFEQTGREITLEYILLDNINCGQSEAAALARICRRLRCNVNLLRYNPIPDLPFARPSSETTYAFQKELRERGVNAHVRTSRGLDIDAACGQLRRRASGE